MKSGLLLTAAMLALSCIQAASAKVYQWRDADGNVFYSDQPPAGQVARERTIRQNVINSGTASAPKREASPSYAVTLYISQGCGLPCEEALGLLDSRKVEYEVRTVGSSEAEMIQFINAVGSMSTRPPVMIIGKEVIKNWDRAIWSAALSKAGFKLPQR
ncbi:hypothetical protein IGB42_03648 [Andreprevotia sp. IGB-42]|uniref:glutaredoxin family protein n=1 Tax=Andreprevotia sp. IGB-42 TaxID=2497473 RepID=UPI00135AEACF|nr:glutaredoxin family protein [Andreprevotia sp. IGB-42]KAF0811838.1 hypothetical protein IGB42_03648 [Andreprevotia sp. IGB-42]